LICSKWAILHLQPDIQEMITKQQGDQKRDAPTPVLESRIGHLALGSQDHSNRKEQAQGGSNLNEAGVEARLCLARVPPHKSLRRRIRRRAPILEDAQHDQDDGGEPPRCRVARQRSHQGCGAPMIVSVTMKAYLRPTLSPIRPKKSAPKGRTIKPIANVAR